MSVPSIDQANQVTIVTIAIDARQTIAWGYSSKWQRRSKRWAIGISKVGLESNALEESLAVKLR
ncbi:hypothetical protein [Egbenema bharatensis]|uniref:hypothetical protein n=1 Tax=Egbenema bharatensis TaxID=3463334 RepID=UPI003A8C83AF